jgi:hypothetical protein
LKPYPRILSNNLRNDINEVSRFFNTKYGKNNYRIYKLTEDTYDFTKFNNNVIEFPFPDHHPPPFGVLLAISKSIADWLGGGKNNNNTNFYIDIKLILNRKR